MRKVAIFDIDGMLIKVSSERQFFKYLIAEKNCYHKRHFASC